MTIEKTLTIVNKLGLHARAATQLVQLANQFDAKIILVKGDKQADANSVLGLMMLESHQGEQVKVVVEGKVQTYDMAKMSGRADVVEKGAASTAQMADAIIDKL